MSIMRQLANRLLDILEAPDYWGMTRELDWTYTEVRPGGFHFGALFSREGRGFLVGFSFWQESYGTYVLGLMLNGKIYEETSFEIPDGTTMGLAVYRLINSAASDVEELLK